MASSTGSTIIVELSIVLTTSRLRGLSDWALPPGLGASSSDGLCGHEHRLAPIVDTGRARFRAIGERLKQIGQLSVAMLFDEPRHIVGPATAARLAHDSIGRLSVL